MAQKLNIQDLAIRSRAFEPHGRIPERHTGDGDNVAPALEWTGAPVGTEQPSRDHVRPRRAAP